MAEVRDVDVGDLDERRRNDVFPPSSREFAGGRT